MKQKTKKEPEEVKSKDGVIRRNLDRIRVSAATPQSSNTSRRSQVSLTEKFSPADVQHKCLDAPHNSKSFLPHGGVVLLSCHQFFNCKYMTR